MARTTAEDQLRSPSMTEGYCNRCSRREGCESLCASLDRDVGPAYRPDHHLQPLDYESFSFETAARSRTSEDRAHSRHALWISNASMEMRCPTEIDRLTMLTEKQREYAGLRCKNFSFQEIGDQHRVSKQSVWRCLERAKKQIRKHRDQVGQVLNASPCAVTGGVTICVILESQKIFESICFCFTK